MFESRHNVQCDILESYTDDVASGKVHPCRFRYTFEQGDQKLTYTLESKKIIEAQGFKNQPLRMRIIAKKLTGTNLSYSRYLGLGSLVWQRNGETIERSHELIYEIMFPGDECIK